MNILYNPTVKDIIRDNTSGKILTVDSVNVDTIQFTQEDGLSRGENVQYVTKQLLMHSYSILKAANPKLTIPPIPDAKFISINKKTFWQKVKSFFKGKQ